MDDDRQGHLVWASDVAHRWVGSLARQPAPHHAGTPLPTESAVAVAGAKRPPKALCRPVLSWTSSCPGCSAQFLQKPETPDRYELKSAGPYGTDIVQKHRKQALTTVEWQRIAAAGASDAEIASADLETLLSAVRDGSLRQAVCRVADRRRATTPHSGTR